MANSMHSTSAFVLKTAALDFVMLLPSDQKKKKKGQYNITAMDP